MNINSVVGVFLLALLRYVSACKHEPETPDWRMTLKTIRNGIHRIDTYLNAALDLFGGDDGLCHYKCSDGERTRKKGGFHYLQQLSFTLRGGVERQKLLSTLSLLEWQKKPLNQQGWCGYLCRNKIIWRESFSPLLLCRRLQTDSPSRVQTLTSQWMWISSVWISGRLAGDAEAFL